jgi:hypothetical protein
MNDEVTQELRELRKELRRAIKIYVIFWGIAWAGFILFWILKFMMGW